MISMASVLSPDRLRRARRGLGFALVGVAAYGVALTFCFPYDRARETAIAVAAKAGYDVEIGAAGPSFPFGISFQDIRLRSRTTSPAAKPIQVRLDSVRVALLPMIFSKGESFDAVANGLGGQIAFEGHLPKKGAFKIDLTVREVAMAQIPGARDLFNLPLGGTLGATVRLDSPSGKMVDARGEIEVKCAACTVGDGKTAAKLGNNPFLAAGLTLPRVRLGDVAARVVVEKGVAKAQGIAIKSPDAELTLDAEITLHDPVALSVINAYLRFKLGEPLLRGSPTIGSILQMAGAPGLRGDGFYGLRVSGTLSSPFAALSPTSPLPAAPSTSPRFGSHTSNAPGVNGQPSRSASGMVAPVPFSPPPAPPPPPPAPPRPVEPPPAVVEAPPPPPPSPPPPPPPPPNPTASDPAAAVPGRPAAPPLAFDVMRGTLIAHDGGTTPGAPNSRGGPPAGGGPGGPPSGAPGGDPGAAPAASGGEPGAPSPAPPSPGPGEESPPAP
jgi:type II secretion system protein N